MAVRAQVGQVVHVIQAVCVPVVVSGRHADSDLIDGMGFPIGDEDSFTSRFLLVRGAGHDPEAESLDTWHTQEECPWQR